MEDPTLHRECRGIQMLIHGCPKKNKEEDHLAATPDVAEWRQRTITEKGKVLGNCG